MNTGRSVNTVIFACIHNAGRSPVVLGLRRDDVRPRVTALLRHEGWARE